MNNKIIILALLFFALIPSCSPAKFSYQRIANGVEVRKDSLNLRLQFYSDQIVRVLKWRSDGTAEKKSLIIVTDAPEAVTYDVVDGEGLALQRYQ